MWHKGQELSYIMTSSDSSNGRCVMDPHLGPTASLNYCGGQKLLGPRILAWSVIPTDQLKRIEDNILQFISLRVCLCRRNNSHAPQSWVIVLAMHQELTGNWPLFWRQQSLGEIVRASCKVIALWDPATLAWPARESSDSPIPRHFLVPCGLDTHQNMITIHLSVPTYTEIVKSL